MHRRVLIAIASMALGSAAAATDESPAPERTLLLDEVRSLACEGFTPQSIGFSRDGTRVASAGIGRVVIWNVQSGEQQATIAESGRWFMDVAFSPDGKTIAATGKPVHALRVEGEAGDTRVSVAFSPDGCRLYSAPGFGRIHEWDVRSGTLLRTLRGHGGGIVALAMSPDGNRLASSSVTDETMRLWDLVSGEVSGVQRDDVVPAAGWPMTGVAALTAARSWGTLHVRWRIVHPLDVIGGVRRILGRSATATRAELTATP